MAEPASAMDNECFVVSPIGETGSEIRRRADVVRDLIITPAASRLGLHVLRADQIADPGNITDQVIEHVYGAPLVVADLTGRNPNVFYELAVRHSYGRPVVLIADEGESIPFDLAAERVVWLTLSGGPETLLRHVATVEDLESSMRAALDRTTRSPVMRVAQPVQMSDAAATPQDAFERIERQLAEISGAINSSRVPDQLASLTTEVQRLVGAAASKAASDVAEHRLDGFNHETDRRLLPELERIVDGRAVNPLASRSLTWQAGTEADSSSC